MVAHASRRNPTAAFQDQERDVIGFRVNDLPIRELSGFVFENIKHEFSEDTARLVLKFKSSAELHAVWPRDAEQGFFYVDRMPGLQARTTKYVREAVSGVGVIPVLTPIEHREEILRRQYVAENQSSRLASRHFRNQLHGLGRDDYDEFISFALENTPEVASLRLALDSDTFPPELDFFYVEAGGRREKELYWAGDGMQIWLQILYQLYRHRDADVLVLDEPDVYLHPDLQRRLINLLEDSTPQTIVATHAPEMLTEASRETVVWVDRTRRTARRVRDEKFLDQVNVHLGSGFNLGVARALRSKLALFVEGKDMKLLKNLARTSGAGLLARERGVTVIPLEGFSNWANVKPFSWMAKELLGNAVKVAVLLDRDYRGSEAIFDVEKALADIGVECHVWRRKELESYLIVPSAIARMVDVPFEEVEGMLDDVAEDLRIEVQSNFLAQRRREIGDAKLSEVTVNQALIQEFEQEWTGHGMKLEMARAKDLLHGLNAKLQTSGKKAVSARALSVHIRRSEVASELADFVLGLEEALRTS
ncbi:putative AbiEii toxin of type IV toxin-antitoxin system [Pseudosporangium ferrugineum]|uniref:Putative AbiEii toxin of type IV toxin-antitoxin system n=2 Tax=Pseudosporangium ferrugineum TaxID=439699 RepID=A0A2T0R7A7_9ACTN|nr:putative AbiEii toxin of type IV toxin-antitoxin system [Pseudosporangium ferrugineum]